MKKIAISVLSIGLLSGCEAFFSLLDPTVGALDGSNQIASVPAGARSSSYSPPKPLSALFQGLLGHRQNVDDSIQIVLGAGRFRIEPWFWVIGPRMRTSPFSFPHVVHVEVISGKGVARFRNLGSVSERLISGGTDFYINAGESVEFVNSAASHIDIQATYFIAI